MVPAVDGDPGEAERFADRLGLSERIELSSEIQIGEGVLSEVAKNTVVVLA